MAFSFERYEMMKRLVLGLVVYCGVAGAMCEEGVKGNLRERSLSDSKFYDVVKEKYRWTIPEELMAKTIDDIDKVIMPCVGSEFFLNNVHSLFHEVAKNPSYSNYVHLVFDEYSLKSDDWKLAYVSSVLNYAAVCYGLKIFFTSKCLVDLLQKNIEEDPWELKTGSVE